MLILKRKLYESIVIQIGEVIVRVSVTRHNREGVWLGIEAAPEVRVDRDEIYELRRKADGNAH